MIEIQLPPSIAALCQSCETICEKECCGIGAFSFSPFNVIYHLTKWEARIRDSDVATIRSELADLAASLQSSDTCPEQIVLTDLNAILTDGQVLSLIGEINYAVTEACALYVSQKDQIDERYQNFLRIIKVPE